MSMVRRSVRYLDERLGTASFARKTLRKVFPDHWSFLLGEIALFALVVLVFTGVFLTFFYTPDARPTVYQGAYEPMRGKEVSAAYESVLRLSFQVRGGLLMRQVHHWAALVFVAAVVVHLCRVFFTGAFRRPREVNWLVGIVLLLLAMAEGFTGYSLPDDLLSGIGLRIFYSVVLGIPLVGSWSAYLLFGGEFPAPDIISRVGLLFVTTAVLAALGGLAQINPVWQYGPYVPFNVTSPAQPDWYIGWLDGALRLGGPWSFTVFGFPVSEVFWPAVLLPGIAFGTLTLWPWIERRFSRDQAEHHLLDRPREAPLRSAIGLAGLWVFFVMFLEGGNDIISVLLNISVENITRVLQVAFVVGPFAVGLATYVVCKSLQKSHIHPATATAGLELRRTADGGYETVPLEPTSE